MPLTFQVASFMRFQSSDFRVQIWILPKSEICPLKSEISRRERALEASVGSLTLGGRDGHDVAVRGDVGLHDLFGLRHRVGVAEAIHIVGLDEILLMRRRRVDAL